MSVSSGGSMKKILIGLLLLGSFSAFADIFLTPGESVTFGSNRIFCSYGTNANLTDVTCSCKYVSGSPIGPESQFQLIRTLTNLRTGKIISNTVIDTYRGNDYGQENCQKVAASDQRCLNH
jgi:hypothetical protein